MANPLYQLTSQIGAWIQSRLFRVTTVTQQLMPSDPREVNNNPPVYADPKAGVFVRDGFSGNASVYTIVSKAARKFGHITRGVYAITDEKALKSYNNLCKHGLSTKEARVNAARLRKKAYNNDTIVKGKLQDLITRPNKWQGQDSFFELIDIFYKITGEAFIWLNRGDTEGLDDSVVAKMPVLEMYVLPSQNMQIIPDLDDPWDIKGYWFELYGLHGNRFYVRKCDVIHWKTANPNFDAGPTRQHLRGLPPLRAGNKILTQDDDSTDATVSMYQNGGAKGVLYNKTLDKLSPEQSTQLKGVIDTKVNNRDMKAAVATLQGDWGYVDIGLDSVEMELLKGGEQAFTRLCNLLDIPPAMFLVDQTYENKAAAIKDWLTNSVIPACCSLRDEMNRVLLPAFGLTGVTIDNDISDIPELQEDMGKLVTWMNIMPWLTPNEKREYLGEEPSAEDGMDDIWIPNNLIRLSDSGMDGIVSDLTDQGMNDYVDSGAQPAPKKNGQKV